MPCNSTWTSGCKVLNICLIAKRSGLVGTTSSSCTALRRPPGSSSLYPIGNVIGYGVWPHICGSCGPEVTKASLRPPQNPGRAACTSEAECSTSTAAASAATLAMAPYRGCREFRRLAPGNCSKKMSTWIPNVYKTRAFWATFGGFGLLFCILLASR